jgi:hypothetical protein
MSTNKLVKVEYNFNSSYMESIGRQIMVQDWSWAKTRDPTQKSN